MRIKLRAEAEDAIAQLRPLREAEQLRLEELAAGSRAQLAALLPQIEAHPVLRGTVELLEPGQPAEGVGPEVHGA